MSKNQTFYQSKMQNQRPATVSITTPVAKKGPVVLPVGRTTVQSSTNLNVSAYRK